MKAIPPNAALKNDQDEQLQLSHEIPYVKKKQETTKTEITDTNQLAVKGEDGDILAIAKLQSSEPKAQGLAAPAEKKQPLSPVRFAAAAALLLGVTITGLLMYQTRRTPRRR